MLSPPLRSSRRLSPKLNQTQWTQTEDGSCPEHQHAWMGLRKPAEGLVMFPRLKGGLPTSQNSVSSASLVPTRTSGPLRATSGVTELPEDREASPGSWQACSFLETVEEFLSLLSRMHHGTK